MTDRRQKIEAEARDAWKSLELCEHTEDELRILADLIERLVGEAVKAVLAKADEALTSGEPSLNGTDLKCRIKDQIMEAVAEERDWFRARVMPGPESGCRERILAALDSREKEKTK